MERIDAGIAWLEFDFGTNNHLDPGRLGEIADALESASADGARVAVIDMAGRVFSAGLDLSKPRPPGFLLAFYREAARLFAVDIPWIVIVKGAAVGGGLGLAVAADFRIGTPEARFCAPFVTIGSHPGFALSRALSRVVGAQAALDMMLTGRRVKGREARRLGLLDRLVPLARVGEEARAFAAVVAGAPRESVRAIRTTLRGDLVRRAAGIMSHEASEQIRLRGDGTAPSAAG